VRPTKGESIDAYEGGGSSCISVEGSVMELERRGWVNSHKVAANPAKAGEELDTFCVGLRPRGFKRMVGMSRMNREIHVRFCGGLEVKFLRSTRLSVWHRTGMMGEWSSLNSLD